MPIIKYFENQGKLWRIDGNKSASEVSDEVIPKIDKETVFPNALRFSHTP